VILVVVVWRAVGELFVGEVINAILITEFELGGFHGLHEYFEKVKFCFVAQILGAGVIGAFVDGNRRFAFPQIQSAFTVWTPERGFIERGIAESELEQSGADLASDLSTGFAVVVIEILGWSRTEWTRDGSIDSCPGTSGLYWSQTTTVTLLIRLKKTFPVINFHLFFSATQLTAELGQQRMNGNLAASLWYRPLA